MPTDYSLIFCTCPDHSTASKLATDLVTAKLAACINILPAITSIYSWQGQIETTAEVLLMIKSDTKHYAALETLILQLHPYQVPEIIAISIDQGFPDYLHWINICLTCA
jgi:periplasmic divalent cation tolerance protein